MNVAFEVTAAYITPPSVEKNKLVGPKTRRKLSEVVSVVLCFKIKVKSVQGESIQMVHLYKKIRAGREEASEKHTHNVVLCISFI